MRIAILHRRTRVFSLLLCPDHVKVWVYETPAEKHRHTGSNPESVQPPRRLGSVSSERPIEYLPLYNDYSKRRKRSYGERGPVDTPGLLCFESDEARQPMSGFSVFLAGATMSIRPTKGLNKPQRLDKSFVGGYVQPSQKRKLAAIAELQGTSINGMLATMIDHLDVDLAVTYPTGHEQTEPQAARC